MTSSSRPACLFALGLSLVPASALAGTPPASAAFLDGGMRVVAERLGPEALDAQGRSLTPVTLRYPGRDVRASIGRNAVLQLDPAASAVAFASAAHVRLVRPLMASAGLWLVEDEGEGDGLDVAARLSTKEARRGVLREAVPDLHLRIVPRGAPFVPDDPRFTGQWYFDDKHLRMSEAWGMSRGDEKTTIVVVDTGCDLQHPDLAPKLDPGRDVVDGDDDPSFDPAYSGAAHGTACAGLAGAATDNGVGIAGGCPDCRVRCVRLITDVALPISATVEAFDFALQTGAAVVTNSWGYAEPTAVPSVVRTAIEHVFDQGRGGKGALVFFAAGNDDRALQDDEMTSVRGVLTIGAITFLDDKTYFTNRGDALDLVAPVGTLTTDIAGAGGDDPGDYTNNFGGTSSACPVAAAAGALLASAAPDKTSAEISDILVKTARPAPYAAPDAKGHDPVFGYGIIDPVAALQRALGLDQKPPAPTPPAADDGCACTFVSAGSTARGGAGLYALAFAAFTLRRRRARR
jgi:subtilisin family serine protease